jgi:tripartite ATP-independent transporter DctP family solute receptor
MKAALIALSAASLLAHAAAAPAQQTRIRVAHATATSHPFHIYAEMFKQAAEKKSGGKLQIQLFPARQLCDDRQCLEGTVAGTIDASLVSTVIYPLVVKKPAFDALQLPFLISSYENFAKLATSPAVQSMLDDLSTVGLKGLAVGEGGQRHFLSSKGPVQKIADFKGLKTRIVPVPLHKAMWEATGAAPVGIAYGEVYTSLQTKVIDAVEINVSSVEGENMWEPAKHFTYTGHYFWPFAFAMNKAKFDALPADLQKVMSEAAREIVGPQVMAAKADEEKQSASLRKKGVQFYKFSEMPQMRERMKPIIDQWIAKDRLIADFVQTANRIEAGK